MDLTHLKQAIAIDTDVFDDVLTLSMKAAERYIQNAVGTEYLDFYQNNDLYDLAVIQLTDHYFKTRSATTEKGTEVTLYGLSSIILQLKPLYRIYVQKQETSEEL